MNKKQAQVTEAQLKAEQLTLKRLKKQYKEALDDVNGKIGDLMMRTDTENLQSIIYQVNYQTALKTQITGILDQLEGNQFNTISEYLTEAYDNGFLGTLYDLHDQGIPLIFPINQKQALDALTVDSKLSKPLYHTLGESVAKLKHNIQRNLSRGIAQGASYSDISKMIAKEMVGDYSHFRGGAYYVAERITRTEGHRIQNQGALDAQFKAQEKGADIVKQWDATLDDRTRPDHAEADGQIRKLDEDFLVGGEWLPAPGIGGSAGNVINCRCACLQRATWALDEDELETLKERAEFYGLDKTADFEDFKKKMQEANNIEIEKLKNQWTVYEDQMNDLESKYGSFDDLLANGSAKEIDAWNEAFGNQLQVSADLIDKGIDVSNYKTEYILKKADEEKDKAAKDDLYKQSQAEWNALEDEKKALIQQYGDEDTFVATASISDLQAWINANSKQDNIVENLNNNGFSDVGASFLIDYNNSKENEPENEPLENDKLKKLEEDFENWKQQHYYFTDDDIEALKEEGSELAKKDYDSLNTLNQSIVDEYMQVLNYENEIENAKQEGKQETKNEPEPVKNEELEKAQEEFDEWKKNHGYSDDELEWLINYGDQIKEDEKNGVYLTGAQKYILGESEDAKVFLKKIEELEANPPTKTKKEEVDDTQKKQEKEIKELEEKIQDAKDVLDGFDLDTYSGIWKEDVTAADYASKKDSISKKEQYYINQMAKLDPDDPKYQQFSDYLFSLKQFEEEGKQYYDAQQNLKKLQKDLKKIQQGDSVGAFSPDAYTEETKNAALHFRDATSADKYHREHLDEVWNDLTDSEKYAVWAYTENSNPMNRPLSGYKERWDRYKFQGVGNVDWNAESPYYYNSGKFTKYGNKDGTRDFKKAITNLTNAIEKSELQDNAFFVRGSDNNGLAGLLEGDLISYDQAKKLLDRGDIDTLKQLIEGESFQSHSFLSTGIAEGTGFGGSISYEIYAPAGTKCIYAEPQSYYGSTHGRESDTLYKVGDAYYSVGYEAEVIFQRGSYYRITEITKSDWSNNYKVKMEVVDQPDYFKKGDEETFNNGKTRHKK